MSGACSRFYCFYLTSVGILLFVVGIMGRFGVHNIALSVCGIFFYPWVIYKGIASCIGGARARVGEGLK